MYAYTLDMAIQRRKQTVRDGQKITKLFYNRDQKLNGKYKTFLF